MVVLNDTPETRSYVQFLQDNTSVTVDWWTNWEVPPVCLQNARTVVPNRDKHNSLPLDFESVAANVTESVLADTDSLDPVIREILGRRLRDYCENHLRNLNQTFTLARTYFEQISPDTALCSVPAKPMVRMIADAAENTSVPFVTFQHGGNYGYIRLETVFYTELELSDIFDTWGQSVSEELAPRPRSAELDTKTITTGIPPTRNIPRSPVPESWSAATESIDLLYIPTGYIGDRRYRAHYWYDDTCYYIHQREFLSFLEEQDGISTTVKIHPAKNVKTPIGSGEDDITVVRDGNPLDLLLEADMAVLD